jgi:hypothetical protein
MIHACRGWRVRYRPRCVSLPGAARAGRSAPATETRDGRNNDRGIAAEAAAVDAGIGAMSSA